MSAAEPQPRPAWRGSSWVSPSIRTAALPRGRGQLGIVATAVALAAAVGAAASAWVDLAVVLGLAAAAAAMGLVARPQLLSVTLLVAGLTVPLTVSTGSQSDLNPVVLLAPALLVLGAVARFERRSDRALTSPLAAPLLAAATLAATAVTSFAASRMLHTASPGAPLRAQLGGVSVYLVSVAALLLAAWTPKPRRDLALLTGVFLVIGSGFATLRLVPLWKPSLPAGAAGSLFWVWLVAMAAAQAIGNRSLRRSTRVALALAVTLALVGNLTRSAPWVSGWLPPLVALLVVLALQAPRRTAIALLVAVALVGAVGSRWLEDAMVGENLYSLETRLAAAEIMGAVILAHPILGSGPANYYWQVQRFPIVGWYVPFSSHSQYLDLLAQLGAIGLVAFVWLVLATARTVLRLHRSHPTGFTGAYAVGVAGGLVGSLVAGLLGDWILPFVYNTGIQTLRSSVLFWLFLGGAAALAGAARAGELDQEPAA